MSARGRRTLRALAAAAATGAALGVCAQLEARFVPLLFVALVPLLAALDRAGSMGEACAVGLAVCVAFTALAFSWFGVAVADYTGGGAPLWVALVVAAAPVLQPQIVVFALARHAARVRAPEPSWVPALVGVCAWLGTEWLWPKLLGDTLGHGLWPAPRLRQAADLLGAPGLTAALLLGNEAAFRLVRALATRSARRIGAAAAVALAPALLLLGYGELRLRALAAEETRPLRVGVVQTDIGRYEALRTAVGDAEAVARILDAHFALTVEAARRGTELIVWPETAYPTTFGEPRSEDAARFDRAIGSVVHQLGIPLVFGAFDARESAEYNAAFFLARDGDGRVAFDTYHKVALFPLTERLPPLLDLAWIRRAVPWLGTWKAGAAAGSVVPIALPGGRMLRAAPLICYDAVQPGHAARAARAGGELLVVLSNDTWFARGAGARLHLAVSGFRTLETRLPQVRATPTGISAVLDASGEPLAWAGVHQRTALVADVPLARRPLPLAARFPEALGPAAAAIGAALLLGLRGRERRRPPGRR